MKCLNKIIFRKLIFSLKVLMYCSRENTACFLCLLIIFNALWTNFMMEVNMMNPEPTATHATI